jgi:hypothetical protein
MFIAILGSPGDNARHYWAAPNFICAAKNGDV